MLFLEIISSFGCTSARFREANLSYDYPSMYCLYMLSILSFRLADVDCYDAMTLLEMDFVEF